MDSIRQVLRAAAIAAFTVGVLLMLVNPPELSGAGDLLTMLVGAIALVLLAAWATVALMGRTSLSEQEFDRLVERSEQLSRRPLEVAGLAALIVPILAAATLAHAQLGSLAASNKLSSRGIDPSALARLASRDAHEIGFLQLNAAGRDADLSKELGLGPGTPVHLVGFVSSDPDGRGRFELSRFYITCCVADAVPVGVHVARGSVRRLRARRDDWLDVTGVLARGDREWIVRAVRVQHVDAPSDPYLSFAA